MAARYGMAIEDARILGTSFSATNWTWEDVERWMEGNGIDTDGRTARRIFSAFEEQEARG